MTRQGASPLRAGLVCALALVTLRTTAAQPLPSRFDPVVDVARRELQDTRTPGAAIALIEGDRIVFSTGVGVADVETSAPVKPDMIFRLGSTTKMFTAAALVTLAHAGKVRLDAPIGGVVPGLDAGLARLTPHHLLSHTAGLSDGAQMFGRQDDEALGAEIRAMTTRAFFTEPGTIYSYSNPGYWIAGLVVEQITGTSYADAMRDLLFTPLGMTRSTFRPTQAMTFPLAQGHEASAASPPVVIRPAANNVANWPAGSLFSNVHDLSRFVVAFMNEGRLDGRQVIAPAVIASLASPHAPIPAGEVYGYGLTLTERQTHRIVSHGGSRAGYGSTIMMAPDRRAGVVVLGNRTGSGLPKTTARAMEVLLGLPAGTMNAPSPTRTTAATNHASLSAWIGTYTQGAASIEIALKDGRLVCRDGSREFPATPAGELRLSVASGAAGETPGMWTLVPDAAGKPAFVFRGGRTFRRVEP